MVVLALGRAGLGAVLGGDPQVGRARVKDHLGAEGRKGGGERRGSGEMSRKRFLEVVFAVKIIPFLLLPPAFRGGECREEVGRKTHKNRFSTPKKIPRPSLPIYFTHLEGLTLGTNADLTEVLGIADLSVFKVDKEGGR